MRVLKHSPPMTDKEEAFDGLTVVSGVLDRLSVPWCLDGGTLLGFVRDGWFFPHDYDIDITLLDQSHRLREVHDASRALGFSSRGLANLGPPEYSWKLFLQRGSAKIDIVSKVERDGMALWTLMHNRVTVKSAPAAFYKQLRPLSIRGVTLSVPREAEAYLSWRFPGWETPKGPSAWVKYRDDMAYVAARNGR